MSDQTPPELLEIRRSIDNPVAVTVQSGVAQ